MKKLLVVIPTKNQKSNLLKIVTILKASLTEIDHQIIISNNSNRDLDVKLSNLGVIQLKTPHLFITAEQHLFWLIEKVSGDYVWFLGDDDIPIAEGVKKLSTILNLSDFDCYAFNGLRERVGRKTPIKMISKSDAYQGKIQYFYKNVGLLNGPASISLYIMKMEFLKREYINNIENLKAPIYSHLTLFIQSFNTANFSYNPIILIKHGKSDKEEGKAITRNWVEHSKESENFYNFPWTLGLLRNIDYLVKANVLKKDFLKNLVETGSRNQKYLLTAQIEDNIRQIFVSAKAAKYRITNDELEELKHYVSEIEGFSEEIKMILSSSEPDSLILGKYPHINPKLGYLRHKKTVLKHRSFILFKQMPKDFYWIFVTKLWVYLPSPIKLVLKKLKFRSKKMP